MKQKEPTEWVNIMVVGNEGTQIRIYIQPKTLKNIEDVITHIHHTILFKQNGCCVGYLA